MLRKLCNGSFSCLFILSLVLMPACSGKETGEGKPAGKEGAEMEIEITSPVFTHNSPIPAKYTCDGENISPPLAWSGIPEGTKSIALICDDPDAPMTTWVHWVIYGIPPGAAGLEEGVPAKETLPDGAVHGKNNFGKLGYGGPCPPRGKPHRYFFKIYALDTALELEPGAKKKKLLKAMENHVIANGELIGTYQRE